MHKRAPTDCPVHDFITERWSPRAFSDKPVAPDVLASLFEAARWAPSSSNEQPWAYIVATKNDPESFAKLVSVLVPGNVTWAQHAPVLALAIAQLSFAKSGTPNRNAQYDVGASSAWLTSIKWPAMTTTKRGTFSEYPQAGSRLPQLLSAIRVIRNRCRNLCAIAKPRHELENPSRRL